MIVAMQELATEEQIDAVIEEMVEAGVNVHRTTGASQTILAGVGPRKPRPHCIRADAPASCTCTASARHTNSPAAASALEGTIVKFENGVEIGGKQSPSWPAPAPSRTKPNSRDRAAR